MCVHKLADYESINASITRYLCAAGSMHSTKYIGKQSSTDCVKHDAYIVLLIVLDYVCVLCIPPQAKNRADCSQL